MRPAFLLFLFFLALSFQACSPPAVSSGSFVPAAATQITGGYWAQLPPQTSLSPRGSLWKGILPSPVPLTGALPPLTYWQTRYQQTTAATPFDYLENSLFNEGLATATWDDQALLSPAGLMWFPKADTLFVNLYLEAATRFYYQEQVWALRMKTLYPLDGGIRLLVDEMPREAQSIALRIPGWAINRPSPDTTYEYLHYSNRSLTLRVNGDLYHPTLIKGYALIQRSWAKGDRIDIQFPMAVRRVKRKDTNQLAFTYGPLVFVAGEALRADSVAISPSEQYFFAPEEGGKIEGNQWENEGAIHAMWVPFWKRNPADLPKVWLLERQE